MELICVDSDPHRDICKFHSERRRIMSNDLKDLVKREFNVGRKDQQIRLAASILIMVIAGIESNGVLMLIGVGVAALALLQWCPAYNFLGKSTVQKGEKPPIF